MGRTILNPAWWPPGSTADTDGACPGSGPASGFPQTRARRRAPGGSRMHDIVVRGGIIVDRSGAAPFGGDLAIDGDRIVQGGGKAGGGRRGGKGGGPPASPAAGG